MATVKSKMGENPVPKPSNQGSSKNHPTFPNRVSKTNGNSAPSLGDQSKRRGVYGKGQGGSGTGSHKGDSLPR